VISRMRNDDLHRTGTLEANISFFYCLLVLPLGEIKMYIGLYVFTDTPVERHVAVNTGLEP